MSGAGNGVMRRKPAGGSASASASPSAGDGKGNGKKMKQKLRPPNPTLNAALTTAYCASVAWTFLIFAREGTESLALLCGLIGATAVAIVVTRKVSAWVGGRLSSGLLGGAGRRGRDPLAKCDTMQKWQDQCWQLVIHVSMTAFETYVLWDEPWWTDPSTCWQPVPAEQPLKFAARMLYLTQLAIWIYTGFSHRFIEQYHKDYVVMFVHHIFTILLIAGSQSLQYQRIGILVLYVHDASDITVDLLKLFNYLKLEAAQSFFAVEAIFVINLVSWCWYRLWQYPMHVLHGSAYLSWVNLAPANTLPTLVTASKAAAASASATAALVPTGTLFAPITAALTAWLPDGPFVFNEPFPLWAMTNMLLCALLFLHVWWFLLFARIGVKLLFLPPHETGEDEYEGESGHETEESHKTDPFVSQVVRSVCSVPVVLLTSVVGWCALMYIGWTRARMHAQAAGQPWDY